MLYKHKSTLFSNHCSEHFQNIFRILLSNNVSGEAEREGERECVCALGFTILKLSYSQKILDICRVASFEYFWESQRCDVDESINQSGCYILLQKSIAIENDATTATVSHPRAGRSRAPFSGWLG